MFTLLCGNFIRDNTHQILVESAWFCRSYDKDIVSIFRFTVYTTAYLLVEANNY